MDQVQVERSDAGQHIDEEFLALIHADEEFLRAEFDAIISAEWPIRPPVQPPGTTYRWGSSGARGRRSAARPSWVQDPLRLQGVRASGRERSPPAKPDFEPTEKGR